MAYNNGIDGKALLDEISKVIDAAASQYNKAGEEAGEEFVEGFIDGIKKYTKEAKSEMSQLFEDFNRMTNNFKSRKSVSNAEWQSVLRMSKELLKSERYADNVRAKLEDISVTFKNIGKVSGLDKILEEIDKAENRLQSVSWVEEGKNYKKKRSATSKPKVEKPMVAADPAPVIEAEKKKQQAIKKTTGEYRASAEAAENESKVAKEIFSRMSKNSSIQGIKNLEEEAVNVTKALSEMYDAGIRDTEKYMTLQYKLSKILDKMAKSYGPTLKSSGAKDKTELMSWVYDRIEQVTGTDIFSISGVMENLLGDSDFSLFNKSLSGLGMKHVADLLRMHGTYGDWVDTQEKLEAETKGATAAVEAQGDSIEKTAKKALNMASVIKRYNSVMRDAGAEHFEINEGNENMHWNLRDMVSRAQSELDTRYLDMHMPYGSEDKKMFRNERARLQNFVKAYSPYIEGMTTSTDHDSKFDNTPKIEAQTGALREQEKATEASTKATERQTDAISAQGDVIKKTGRKVVDFDHIKKKYNDLMENELGLEYLTIGNPYSEGTANYDVQAMIDEAKYQLSTYYESGHANSAMLEENPELWKQQTKSIRQFIKNYEKYIGKVFKNPEIEVPLKKLGELDDLANAAFEAKDEKELNRIYQERLAIIQQVGEEKLKEYNKNEYDAILEGNAIYEAAIKEIQKQTDAAHEQESATEAAADAQSKLNDEIKETQNVLYHAGDLSNPSDTLKSFPLGNVPPTRSNGIGGLTGLYTTDALDGFIGNEWQGAPISTIDPSAYKLLSVGTDDIADKVGGFLNDVNATIYGYYNAIDENDWEMKRYTDVKSVEELYEAHRELFKDSSLTFEQFTEFINSSREKIAGKSFADIELPAIDEGIAKSGISSAMQDVADEIFNSDSFQTQFLKMLGYEGVDLRGTKYNGTYTGGSVIFDVKPESIKATNEKWSDIMLRNGFEVTEDDLKYEEKRRQLAFDTSKAYSRQADAAKEVSDAQKQLGSSDDGVAEKLKYTFDIIQQGENITGKFVTTASTLQEALQQMRQALPEDQKEWESYIDSVSRREDDRIVGSFKNISGSMGRQSERYKLESLDDGRIAITFSGIRSEIEKTVDVAENANKTIIEGENKYQQELDETTKIQQNRQAQADVYTEAATNLLSAGYESVSVVDQANLMAEFGNKIYTEGISASEAMDQLYLALEKVRKQAESMSDDTIDSFGADNEKLKETVSQLQKLSSVEITRVFDSVDLRGFLGSFNIDESDFALFRSLFEELMQISKAMAAGVDVGNAFDLKMAEITNTIMNLGGHMMDLGDDGYADMLKQFYSHMSKTKVQFNDSIKADYTKDQWKSLYRTYQGRLTADPTKGIPADSLYHELSGLFPSLFPENILSQQDQFKLIFEMLDEARRLQANNWQTLHSFASGERDGVQDSVDDIYNKMSDALFAGSSSDAMSSEADAAKDVANNMNSAANAKDKFANANKRVGDSAKSSADGLGNEADAMEKVATSAEELPDGDIITKLFIGENEDPSAAIVKTMRMVGNKMQTEAKRLTANDDGEWDVTGSKITEKKLRGMQDYIGAYSKEAKKLDGIQANIRALGEDGMSDKLATDVKNYTLALNDMNVAMRALQENPNDKEAQIKFDDAVLQAQKARSEIEGIFKESQKLSKIGKLKIVGKEDVGNVDNLKTAMIEFAHSAFGSEVAVKGFNKEGDQMYITLNKGAGEVENITVALDGATGRLNAFTTGTDKATNEWNEFKKQASDGIKRLATMYLGFNDLIRYGRQGLEYVKEIDLAMTELKKVTDETDASYKEFLKDAGKTASIIGSTVSDFTEATSTFARLGYSMEESSSMAETAIIYKNVADGLDSVEESSESIISTMMAFGIEANDTMSIIDRFNAVGNNFAITSAGIGEALQRSASALYSAGNTLDESVALVTAANSVIQNPEQVGTALKTLALRLRGAKTELEEAGEDVDGMAESTSQLQAKLKALTHGKVDIMLDADTFKNTTQILREMSAAWEDMTDIERASALELMGGKRQANILSSVIQNFETVEDVITTSMESSGSAMAENAKWLDSIEGKTYQFTNALQTMWSNILDSEMIKGFLDFGTNAIEFLDTGTGKVVALVAAYKMLSKFKGFTIGGLFNGLKQSLSQINTSSFALDILPKATTSNVQEVTNSISKYAAAVSGLTPKLQAQALATKGLNNEQIREALNINKVDQATINAVASNVKYNASKKLSAVLTKEETDNLIASNGSKLSSAAADFLRAHATEEINEEMLEQAVLNGTLDAQTKIQIMNALGLTGTNMGLAASFKAIGASIKFMFMSNPVGFLLSIATTILSIIPMFDLFSSEVERTTEEIEQSLASTVSNCTQIVNDFKSLKKSADDVIPRFVELSEGVDNFGKNIKLTDEEYAEFLDLNNQIAEMFPDINMGFDENGNAMLALSGTADTLAESLWNLVKAEREAANVEIANQLPSAMSDIQQLKQRYDDESDEYSDIISALKEGKVKKTKSGTNKELYQKIEQILKDNGIKYEHDTATRNRTWVSQTLSWDASDAVIANLIAGYEKQINNISDQLEAKYKSLNPIISAWMQSDFGFQGLDEKLQKIALTFANGIDFQSLGKTTQEEVTQYINDNILKPLKAATPAAKDAFNQLFALDVSSMSTQEYIDEVNRLIKIIADSDGDGGVFTTEGLKKDLGLESVLDDYEKTAKNIQEILDDNIPKYYEQYEAGTMAHFRSLEEYSAKVRELKDKIYTLSPDKLYKAFDLIKKYGITTWEELQEALESKTFEVVLNYDKEKEGMEKLLTAIEESISATGLSEESISNLQNRYQDLENYDPSRLFEKTANGIHLNVQALRELEDEYQKSYKEDLKEQLKGQIKQYQNLTKKIDECSNAQERASLYTQRQAVLDQIKDTAELASKYDGLTSAYKKWQDAQSNGNERDMYEDIIAGRESMDELMSRGWIDDEVRAYIDLLSGKDLSTASYEEVLAAYKELNKEIGNSGHNIYDFFTKDEDGNSTTDGIFNFFDTVRSVMGETFAWIDENGKYHFDFGVGGDEEIAKKFGMDIEAVQALLRAASDAGFDVNLDSIYSLVDGLQDSTFSAEEATKKLKDLKLISDDIEFNFETEDADNLNNQIEAAQQAVDKLIGDGAELDLTIPGAVEAQTTLAILLQRKNELSEPAWINLDYSKVDESSDAADQAMLAFRNFYEAYNNHEINIKCGVDTETLGASEKEVQKYIDEIKALVANNPDLKAQIESTLNIKLDTVTAEEFASALANVPEEEIIKLLPDGSKVEGYEVDTKTGEVFYNVGTDPTNPNDVNTWTPPTKYGTVVYTAQTVAGSILKKIFGAEVDGTAHVSGTAYDGGSWGAQKTETSLVGELGPEILVRDGKWTTVGENGAEFTQVKKGDIIFNHKQTESLLKNGYVTGRGKAHASGTAFSSGTGPSRFTVTSAYIDGGGADRLKDAADEFLEVFDWIAVRLEEINEEIDLNSAKLENKVGYTDQNKTVEDIIALNKSLKTNLEAAKGYYEAYASKLLNKVDKDYRDLAQNGAIDIDVFKGEIGEKQLEAIKEYREWVQKGADATQQAEEVITEISTLAKQAIDNIATQFENEASLRENRSDQLDAYNELLENKYGVGSEDIYKQLIAVNNTDIRELENKKAAMQSEFNEKVENGEIKKFSQDWYDAVNDIAAVDTEIINLQNDNLDLQDSINEIHWYHSDLLVSQFEAVSEEAENLIDILSTKDTVDEMGNWTDEGITTLGLYAQQMETAQKQAQHYADEIQYLQDHKEELGYTDEEYLDKLDELKSGQYDAIKSYNDTKDAIVDLNKERIDAIKDGIEKEIEAYEELIDKKKEELDAEKDLYDFQKKIKQSTKDIADLERQLAALSADNSASARAKRAQLEAELAEAREELQDSYYERSISNQQEALDKELENFKEEKDAEVEGWEEYLEDTERVVSDSLAVVQANTDTVLQTLNSMGNEYSLNITNALTSPWENGSTAISNYQTTFGTAVSETMDMLDELSAKYDALEGSLANEVETQGQEHIQNVNDSASKYSQATEKQQSSSGGSSSNDGASTPSTAGMVSSLSGYIRYGDRGDKVKKLQQALNDLGFNCGSVDGKFGPKTLAAVKAFQRSSAHGGAISADGIVGPNTKKKFKTAHYAKGTVGVDDDQWALINELGEELVLRAHNGKLTYLEKGSGVVPADLTTNLMEWGKLDPSIMLDQNRPHVGVHPEVHNTQIQIDNSIAELIHIDHCDQSTLPDVEKIVNNALEKHTQRLNQSLRKFAR